MTMRIHNVLFFVLLLAIENIAAVFKLTNAHCESLNKTLLEVKQCRLRAVKRGIILLNLEIRLNYPIEKVYVEASMLKRANGYKPFLMEFKIDLCEYMKRKNHPFINMVFKKLRNYTNFNHTCPFEDEIIIKDFYLVPEMLNSLPWPTGDYVIKEKWNFNGKRALLMDFYFERVEDLIRT